MKKLLSIILIIFISLTVKAEIYEMHSTAFNVTTSEAYNYDWEDSKIKIEVNLDNDCMKIYSNEFQFFKFIVWHDKVKNGDDLTFEITAIDNNGKKCQVKLYYLSWIKSIGIIEIIYTHVKYKYRLY
jgi:hypothetical protein